MFANEPSQNFMMQAQPDQKKYTTDRIETNLQGQIVSNS